MSSPPRRVICGSFRALEAALYDHLAAIRQTAPLAPVVVAVPNAMLRLHLARGLAEGGCPHANIHFLTLHQLAGRIAENCVLQQELVPEPPFAARLVLGQSAITRADALRYFRAAAEKEGCHEALLAAFRDLREAGLAPPDLDKVIPAISPGGPLRDKLFDVALLWRDLEAVKTRCRFYDDIDLLKIAVQETLDASWLRSLKHLILYGAYDFTGLQQALLAACFRTTASTVYFPHAETEAFAYAQPGLVWLMEQGFRKHAAHEPHPDEGAPLFSLQQNLFSPHAPLSPNPAPAGLKIISAPGEAREVESVLREILHPPDGPGGEKPTRIGVLLRSGRPYVQLLHEALEAVGIQGYFNQCRPLSHSRSGKGLLLLTGLLGSRMKRCQVMDFLSVADLHPLDELTGHVENPPVALWNRFTIDAGIVEGRHAWDVRLAELPVAETEQEALHAFRNFLAQLFDVLQETAGANSWQAMATTLGDAFRARVLEDTESARVLDQLADLAKLDTLGIPPSADTFRAFLNTALDSPSSATGRFDRQNPAVTPLMQARGVPFDVVILPGMVEKSFPQPPRQDPILLDAERRALISALARHGTRVNLPLKSRRRDEEKLLFALAVQSARKRLVLTFPRLDAANARPRMPSHFLLRALEAVTGKACDFDDLDHFVRTAGNGVFVRMTRLNPALRNTAVHCLEYDLASLAAAGRENQPDAIGYLAETCPFFGRALEAETARYGTPSFTPYDSVLTSPEILKKVLPALTDVNAVVSPTPLETYARCPFLYLIRHVLRLRPLEEPEEAPAITPLDRGSLVHNILWEFLSHLARKNRSALTSAHWPQLERIAERRFELFEKKGVTGYPLTWEIEKAHILADLKEFLQREISEASTFQPAHFEVCFGMEPRQNEAEERLTGAPVELALDDGVSVKFKGRIDRIDIDPANRQCRVLDYKTGKLRLKDGGLSGGTALQLPVYLLAASTLLKNIVPQYAAYYLITSKEKFKKIKFTQEHWKAKQAAFPRIVGIILNGIRSGRFYANVQSRHCDFCELRALCGAARGVRFKWRVDVERTRDFLEMASME